MDLKEARKRKKVLIAAHRGNWGGNIPPNTILSYKAALMLGADLVEVDTIRSSDGVFYAYHSGEEKGTFGLEGGRRLNEYSSKEIESLEYINSSFNRSGIGVSRLEDVMALLKGKCFINIDRAWLSSWKETLEFLRAFGMEDQLIIKSPAKEEVLDVFEEYGKGFMYMGIIRKKEEYDLIKSYKGINTVAIETNYQQKDDYIASDEFIGRLHSDGCLIWVNALTLDGSKCLSGGFDDNTSISSGPDKGWKVLLDKGYDIIQTDWPSLLASYIETTGEKK